MIAPVDRETAPSYIRANFEACDRLAIVILNKPSGTVKQRIATAEEIAATDFQAWLRYQNAQRYEIYISMNALRSAATGRTKGDIGTIRHLYLDFDYNGTEAVRSLLGRIDLPCPNYRISSSPGKWQVVWKVEGFTADSAERYQKDLARQHLADRAATDCARVLRLPGFYNHKYADAHLVTVECLSDRMHRPEHFPEPQVARLQSPAVRQAISSKRAQRDLSQSERDFAFAKRALSRGTLKEAVVAAIAAFRCYDKYDPAYYAELTVRNAAAALVKHQPRTSEVPAEPER